MYRSPADRRAEAARYQQLTNEATQRAQRSAALPAASNSTVAVTPLQSLLKPVQTATATGENNA